MKKNPKLAGYSAISMLVAAGLIGSPVSLAATNHTLGINTDTSYDLANAEETLHDQQINTVLQEGLAGWQHHDDPVWQANMAINNLGYDGYVDHISTGFDDTVDNTVNGANFVPVMNDFKFKTGAQPLTKGGTLPDSAPGQPQVAHTVTIDQTTHPATVTKVGDNTPQQTYTSYVDTPTADTTFTGLPTHTPTVNIPTTQENSATAHQEPAESTVEPAVSSEATVTVTSYETIAPTGENHEAANNNGDNGSDGDNGDNGGEPGDHGDVGPTPLGNGPLAGILGDILRFQMGINADFGRAFMGIDGAPAFVIWEPNYTPPPAPAVTHIQPVSGPTNDNHNPNTQPGSIPGSGQGTNGPTPYITVTNGTIETITPAGYTPPANSQPTVTETYDSHDAPTSTEINDTPPTHGDTHLYQDHNQAQDHDQGQNTNGGDWAATGIMNTLPTGLPNDSAPGTITNGVWVPDGYSPLRENGQMGGDPEKPGSIDWPGHHQVFSESTYLINRIETDITNKVSEMLGDLRNNSGLLNQGIAQLFDAFNDDTIDWWENSLISAVGANYADPNDVGQESVDSQGTFNITGSINNSLVINPGNNIADSSMAGLLGALYHEVTGITMVFDDVIMGDDYADYDKSNVYNDINTAFQHALSLGEHGIPDMMNDNETVVSYELDGVKDILGGNWEDSHIGQAVARLFDSVNMAFLDVPEEVALSILGVYNPAGNIGITQSLLVPGLQGALELQPASGSLEPAGDILNSGMIGGFEGSFYQFADGVSDLLGEF